MGGVVVMINSIVEGESKGYGKIVGIIVWKTEVTLEVKLIKIWIALRISGLEDRSG